MNDILEKQFEASMINLCYQIKIELDRNPGYLRIMIGEKTGVGAAKYLLSTDKISSGLAEALAQKKPHITIEALVTDPKWSKLFTLAEIKTAKTRLGSFLTAIPTA